MIAEHVSKLKADVFRSNTWLMLFENKAKILKKMRSVQRRCRYALPRWGGAHCRRHRAARQCRGGARAGEAWDLKYGGRGRAVAMGGGG